VGIRGKSWNIHFTHVSQESWIDGSATDWGILSTDPERKHFGGTQAILLAKKG